MGANCRSVAVGAGLLEPVQPRVNVLCFLIKSGEELSHHRATAVDDNGDFSMSTGN